MTDLSTLTHEQLAEIWNKASSELMGLASRLQSTKESDIAADQLRLAVQMAGRYFHASDMIAATFDPGVTSPDDPVVYGGFLPHGETRTFSIGELRNLIATVQKFYQIFTAVMAAIEPLITPPLGPTPAPTPGVGMPGSLFGTEGQKS